MHAANYIVLTKDACIIFRPLSLEIPLTTGALLYYISVLEKTKFPFQVFLDNTLGNPDQRGRYLLVVIKATVECSPATPSIIP